MARAEFADSIVAGWRTARAILVGNATDFNVRAPWCYVLVENRQRLRLDVYPFLPDCFAFQDAIVWRDLVIVGLGSHVYVVSPEDSTALTIPLDGYFGHLYPTDGYLLVASGHRLLRLEPDGRVLWTSDDLAVDGVVVDDAGPPTVCGEGEWDPPGGWRPFKLDASSGRVLADVG